MQIKNSITTLCDIFPNKIFDMKTWEKYASTISPDLALKCENASKKYDFDREVLPIINSALNSEEKLVTLNDTFEDVTMNLSTKIAKLFDKEIELEIILYLGLCNGAGWATTLNDKDVILLGIEKLIELDWCSKEDMQSLIFHEIGHIWHKTYGSLYFDCNSQ